MWTKQLTVPLPYTYLTHKMQDFIKGEKEKKKQEHVLIYMDPPYVKKQPSDWTNMPTIFFSRPNRSLLGTKYRLRFC